MTEHRRYSLRFQKWPCCNQYTGIYKIICKATQVLQLLQSVLADIFTCSIQVGGRQNGRRHVSEIAELGSDLCPKHCRRKSDPCLHGETAPDLNQQGFQ